MKVLGLISDTHIPSRRKTLPESVIKSFREEKVDMIIHAGDFEDLSVALTLEEIAPLKAVRGNMCHHTVKNKYPKKAIIQVEKLSIGLTHGSGGPAGYFKRVLNEFKKDPTLPDIIISGHTHKPIAKVENNIQFINPGSPTDKYFAPRNTIALLEINGHEYQYRYIEIK